jgi:hypothetical protein
VAEGGGLLNRTGAHQALTKTAKTRNFLKESNDRDSVLCLLMRREPTRSLHNLLHRPEELRHRSRHVRTGEPVPVCQAAVRAAAKTGAAARWATVGKANRHRKSSRTLGTSLGFLTAD